MSRTRLTKVAGALLAATIALAYLSGCQDQPRTNQTAPPPPPASPQAQPVTGQPPSLPTPVPPQGRVVFADDIKTVIVIEKIACPCRIVKCDEKTLTVLLSETNTAVTVEWQVLDAAERRRLRDLIAAYSGSRLVPVRKGSSLFDSLVSPKMPPSAAPQTAEGYFARGEWCMENELPVEADDNFAKAVLLEPGYEERCKAKMPALKELTKRLEVRAIERRIRFNKAAGLNGRVLKDIELLETRYPDYTGYGFPFDKRSIEKARAQEFPREVVGLWHQRVDDEVNACALRGPDSGNRKYVLQDGKTYELRDGKPFEVSGFNPPSSLADCRKYVTDPKSGLNIEVCKSVAQEAGITEARARELWAGRLEATVPGPGDHPQPVAGLQMASWGAGSWLRDVGKKPPPEAGRPAELPDPEVWWLKQSPGVKAQVLKAMWAESCTKVERVFEERCPKCGGSGKIEGSAAPKDADKDRMACPMCRGTGQLCGVIYR